MKPMPTFKPARLLALSLLFACAALSASRARANDPFTWTGTTGVLTVPNGTTQSFDDNYAGGSQIVIGGTDGAGAAVTVSATIIAEPGATFSILHSVASGNVITSAGGYSYAGTSGGAILMAANSMLTLTGAAAGAGGGFLFDSNTAATAGGAIFVGNGATLFVDSATFSNNKVGASTVASTGGAISTAGTPNALTKITINGALFDSNINLGTVASAFGGAIYAGATTTLTVNSSTFQNNYDAGTVAGSGGGAIAVSNNGGVTLNITGALFKSNTSAATGGAIFVGNAATVAITSATFINNTALAGNGGGAVTLNGANNISTIGNAYFASNTASGGNGGAINYQGATNTGTIFSATFSNNYSSAGGGAIANSNNAASIFFLTNVSFYNNTAATSGGAIFLNGGTLAFNVTALQTIQFTGNKASGTSSGIYFQSTNNNSQAATFTIDDTAELDMVDPMNATNLGNNTPTVITKSGTGLWNLGGTNNFAAASTTANSGYVNFTVQTGTLHLYGINDTYTTPDGVKHAITAPAAIALTLASTGATTKSSFNLGSASTVATLSAGGGNIISTNGAINLFPGSTIALDLTSALPDSTSILTLNPAGALTADWTTLNLNLLGLDSLVLANGQTYNLITLGNGKTFADTVLDALTANTTGLDGFSLQLAGSNTLQLLISGLLSANNVLTWTGAAGNGSWTGSNWIAGDDASPATFHQGDIINLASADTPPPATTDPVAINLTASATIAAMYLSGTQSYTLTGRTITSDTFAGELVDTDAATAKLILGASAAPDASLPDTTSPAVAYTGTLTLNNTANNFAGGIEINSGALVGSAASLGTADSEGATGPGITIADAGSLTFNQVTTDTYFAPIRSAATAVTGGNLAKTGAAALTLAADNSAFTGQTTVKAGALLLATGATLGGNVAVNNAATFGGAGSAGNVTLDNAATLQVGIDATSAQTLNLVNLILGDGSRLSYTNLDNTLLLSGNLTQSGTSTLNFLAGTLVTGNSYSLINVAGGLTALNFDITRLGISFKGTILDPTTDYTLAINSDTLWLTINNVPIIGNTVLTWNGAAGDNLWLSSKNWVTQGVTKALVQGDIVNLGGTSAPATTPTELKLADSATVAAMYVSGTQSYTVTGAGSIIATATTGGDLDGTPAANGRLTLGKTAPEDTTLAPAPATFTGTLDLAHQTGTNQFAAGVEIDSGVLRVSTTDQLGAPLSQLSFGGSGTVAGSQRATLQIANNSSITLDGSGTSAPNRLFIAAGNAGDFVLEDNATLTFSNNNSPAAQGAVAYLDTGASLTLTANAGAQYIFTSNTSTFATANSNDGGAFYLAPSSTLVLTGINGGSFNISNNSIGGGGSRRGGAIFGLGLTTVAIDHATFTGNVSTGGNGGAIFLSSTSTLRLDTVLFTSNTALNNSIGGAIALNTNSYAIITSATFSQNNATTTGGALGLINGSTATITDALFSNNTAANGGAISVDPAAVLTLTNVSFLNNAATALGGAIYDLGTVNYNVTAGNIAQIANNTAAGTGNNGANSGAGIYFFNNANNPFLNLNVAPGAILDMVDPMAGTAVNSNTVTITLTGGGLWNLGGSSTLAPQNTNNASPGGINFTVASGTLHLYRAGETSTGGYTPATGNIALTGTNSTTGIRSTFTVNSAATLSAGGGNTISANSITIASGATIALDLSAAARNSTPILTLTTLGGNPILDTAGWTQNLSILNFDLNINYGTDLPGSIYNLIALGNGNLFTTDDLGNLLDRASGLLNGYTLALNADNTILELLYNPVVIINNVLTWNGLSSTPNSWAGPNWTTSGTTNATFNLGDIVNLADTAGGGAPDAANSINVDTLTTATVAGMYLSGTENYTITGKTINASASAGSLAGTDAATGKLILGAKAAADATLDTTSPDAAYTGTLTLSNTTGNFAGGIEINTGALVGNAANLGAGGATGPGITIADAASLTFDQATSGTYTATIRSAPAATTGGSLVKTNTGALTLAADNSTFTGATEVNAGSLLLGGDTAALGGNIHVATAATFGGIGTAGAVTLDAAASLQVGLATQDSALGPQTLTLTSDLNLLDGSRLTYTSVENQLLINGNLYQTGTSTLNLLAMDTGTYSIIDVAGGLATFNTDQLTVNYQGRLITLGDYYTLDIDPAGNLLWLTIKKIPLGINNVLTWTGFSNDGLWLTSTNWTTVGVDVPFTQNDIINLAAAEVSPPASPDTPVAITLADNATVAAMYVSGTRSYFIDGDGGITASATAGALAGGAAANGKLTLGKTADNAANVTTTQFTGTLDFSGMNGSNNFQNGVEINSGALRISSAGQLGTSLGGLQFTGYGMLIAAPDNGIVTFDDNSAGTNRLVVGDGKNPIYATIIADPGATLAIYNAYSGTGASIPGGGAIYVAPYATLVLSGTLDGAGGGFLFSTNTAALLGGAIYVSASAMAIIDSATFTYNNSGDGANNGGAIAVEGGTLSINNSAFTNNVSGVAANAQANGGAISGRFGSVLDISNVLFTSNTANQIGGAIFDNTNGSHVTVVSSTFNRNAAMSTGGAIAMQMNASGTGILEVRDSTFRNNYATTNGGAIWFAINVTGTIANSTFTSNTAGTLGGAIALTGSNDTLTVFSSTFTNNYAATTGGALAYNANYITATLVDTSFYNNTALTDGGAIYLANNGGTLALNVSSGSSATFAGNKAARGPGLFINNNVNMGVTINTDDGGSLNMLDPFFALTSNNSTDTIVKNGLGTWNLGGSSTVTPNGTGVAAALNLTVAEGTLHLYRAGETSYNGVPVATGNLTFTNTTAQATFAFAVNNGATLSAGGGNTIAASSITLQGAANLALDFNNATPTSAPGSVSILTLNPIATLTPNSWTQGLSFLNLDSLVEKNGDIYNLLTLTGASAGSLFSDVNSFNLLTTLPAGYHLQLSSDKTTLQLLLDGVDTSNHVLTWTGNNATGYLSGYNWTASGAIDKYRLGDILNLANPSGAGVTPTGSTAINVNVAGGAILSALYVSGTENFGLTGNSITTTSGTGTLASTNAATGKLILGAIAADNAASIDTTSPAAAYTGTLTLSNTSNNFTGGIEINTGALVGNAANLGAGAPGITIADAGSLTFLQTSTAGSATYDPAIRGSGALNKTGAGSLTLTADNSSFNGQSTINEGALLLAPGARLGGNTTIATAATFGGGNATAGAVTINTGATLQVGIASTDTSAQSLTLSALTLDDASILNYTRVTNQLLITGALAQTGSSTINLLTITSGSYALIQDTSGLAGFSTNLLDLTYKGRALEDGVDYLFNATGNNLWLTVLNPYIGSNHVITWTGASNNLWLTATNWKNDDGARIFVQGDIVNIVGVGGASSSPSTIELTSSATLAAMYVSGNASYAIAGPGAITADPLDTELSGSAAATGKLVLGQTALADTTAAPAAFTGTLDFTGLTGANNFQNGVDINTGALRIATADQLGAPLSKLNFLGDPAETTAPAAILVATGNAITFDGAGSTLNRLVIPAGKAGEFIVEDSSTLTFARTTYSGSGGAAYISAGASLAIQAGAASQVSFSNNSAANDGAAIYLANGASFTFTGADDASILFNANKITGSGDLRGGAVFATTGATVHIDNATFTNNTSRGNGGAAGIVGIGSLLELSNVLFASNTALNSSHGGALMINTDAATIVTNGTFINNYATGNGGAVLAFNRANVTFTNVLFASNTASASNGGGAIFANTNSIITVLSSTFTANSGTLGGAISSIGSSSLDLTDIAIVNNTAALNGGAIYLAGNAAGLSISVSSGNTSVIAGNTAAGKPNGIYLNNNNNYNLSFFVDDGASLDMVDPIYDYMSQPQNPGTQITKIGAGAWNLGGDSIFTPANASPAATARVNFDVQEGTLHLYRAGETSITSSGTFVASTGNITLADPRAALNFSLFMGATLSAGGGNTITASSINLASGATLAFDLNNAIPDDTAVLTLNASSSLEGNGWAQFISLIGLDSIDPLNGDTYNLLSLLNGARFTTAANFLIADDTLLPDGYSLQLSSDQTTLQLLCYGVSLNNLVITWNAAAGDNLLTGANWSSSGSTASYHKGNILNFSDLPPIVTTSTSTSPDDPSLEITTTTTTPVTSATVAINTAVTATVSAIYVSGTTNYTITGNALVTTPEVGTLVGTPADTGKLTLGALAYDDANGFDTTTPFTGTLTLANSWNNFTGGIDILSGALVGNADTLNTGSAPITIASTGALTFAQPTDTIYAGPITGDGAFTKTGAGILTLASPDTNFNGPANITAGALILGDPAANFGGDIRVAANASFGGLGTAGDVTLAAARASLQIGVASDDSGATLQPFNIASLTLADQTILDYASLKTPLMVAGDITQAGTAYINVAAFKAGSYDLGNLATIKDNALITIAGDLQYRDARQQAVLSSTDNELYLNGVGDDSRIMRWTGTANNNMWAPTTNDWYNSATTVFAPGDQVYFGDDAAAGTYTITVYNKGVTASDMFVQGTNNYTFTGGAITTDANSTFTGTVIDADSWTGKLYKSGSSTLTLFNASNNFTGGIELTEGSITFQGSATNITTTPAATVAPGATLQFAGATLQAADLQLADGANLAGAGQITGAATLNGMVNANIAVGNVLTLNNTITGEGAFLKTGPGTLNLNGAPALGNTGDTQINAGTVNITGINGMTADAYFTMPGDTYSVYYDNSRRSLVYAVPSSTYTVDGKTIIVPELVYRINSASIFASTQYITTPFTLDIDGLTVLIPSSTLMTSPDALRVTVSDNIVTIPGVSAAILATNTYTLNGGTLAFGVSGTFTVNEATANDWKNITFVEGDNAAASAISGTSDIIYVGAGTFAPALLNGLIVAVNPGDAGTTVLSNTANTFTGAIRVDSGTLQVFDIAETGAVGAGAKIILNSSAVQFSGSSFTTTGNIEVRGTANIVNVDDGVNATWNAVNRTIATAPVASLTKVGSGTFTLNAALQAASLTVAEGRWVATTVAGAGAAAATVDVSDNAVFELALPASTTGTVASSFSGSGTLLVSSGQAHFSSPNITVDNIYIRGASTMLMAQGGGVLANFSPNGTIIVDQADFELGALNQNVGNVILRNGAMLAFAKAVYVATGTAAGLGFNKATLASLSTDGVGTPLLGFNVNLGQGLGDHLAITAPVSGTYDIAIKNWGAAPSHYTAPIELIKTAAGSNATFNPLQPTIELDGVNSLYKYTVGTTTSADGAISLLITGTGAMSNSVSLINSMAAMMPMSFFSELDSVTQRMGELHFENREAANGFSAWVRGYGNRINYNDKVVAGQPFKETIYGGEAGVDYKLGNNDRRLYAGLFMGYSEGQRDYSSEGDGRAQSVTTGGYLTFSTKDGFYVDGALKLNSFKNTLNPVAPTGERATASYNNWAIGGSLEIGKFIDLGYDWYVTPQIQVAHTIMQGNDYATTSGMSVSLASGAVTRGRVGVMVGRVIETSRHGTIQYYFKAYGGGQWTTGGKIDITSPFGERAHYASTVKGYNFEGGAGLSWLFTKATQVYFDYDTTDAEYYVKPWGFNLGIRHMW